MSKIDDLIIKIDNGERLTPEEDEVHKAWRYNKLHNIMTGIDRKRKASARASGGPSAPSKVLRAKIDEAYGKPHTRPF